MATTDAKLITPDELDYSPLTSPVTRADVVAYRGGHQTTDRSQVLIQVVVAMIIAVIFISALASSGQAATVMFALLVLGIVAGAGAYFYFGFGVYPLVRLARFAETNGLDLKTSIPGPSYPGLIFDQGDSRLLNESLGFPGLGEVGNYEYMTGAGRSRQSHSFGFIRLKLSRQLPHMVLDNRANNFFGSISNLPESYSRKQAISLEGDFDQYFTLYAPQEYGVDARYVFTPDVMAALIDHGQDYDLEIVGDELYMYSSDTFKLTDESVLRGVLELMQAIGAEVRDQSALYSDDRVGNRAANIVAPEGRRLKTVSITWVGAGVLAFWVLVQFPGVAGRFAPILPGVVIILVIVGLIRTAYKARPRL